MTFPGEDFEDLFRALGGGAANVPAAELVYRLYELALTLTFLLVFLEVLGVVEKLGVLGESPLVLNPIAQVVARAAVAPRGARAFTICPIRVALGHLPKVPPGRRLRGEALPAAIGLRRFGRASSPPAWTGHRLQGTWPGARLSCRRPGLGTSSVDRGARGVA